MTKKLDVVQPRIQRASKVRPVQIGSMRTPPALITQRPFKKSWGDTLAKNLDLDKLGFLVINYRDGVHWVCDGQHRVYAMKQNGFGDDTYMDCEVYENLTDAEMANIFLGRDNRRAVRTFDKFWISCTGGDAKAIAIRRAVESNGLKVSQGKTDGCVGSVSALGRVFDLIGENGLGQVLRVARDAFAKDTSGFDSNILQGLGLVFNRYNGRTNEKVLASKLSAHTHGARGVLQRAEAQRVRTGNQKALCVAAVIVDIHNRGAGKRLPNWWKGVEEEQGA